MRISDWSSDVCSSDLRGVFAKAMASNEIRLIGQTNAAFLLKHPQRRNGVRHDRWLGILSESQIAVWSLTQNTEEMLAQRIINFLKYLPCGGTGFRTEENTSEHQSLLRISYAVFCLKK